jgi:death-on-curing protein
MKFLTVQEVIEINKSTISQDGGIFGIRDLGLIESALANPQNLYYYQNANIYTLGACYAVSIAKNHGFLDGNKRTGFASMNAFLTLNKLILQYDVKKFTEIMVAVAESKVDINQLTEFLKTSKA